MPYIDCAASRLYYESYGEGHPVILLHGIGGNHASWFHQVTALRDHYRVIVVDARGFGNSSDVEGRGRSAFLSDLLMLFDELQLSQAALIAQSMGGGTAISFTCHYPQRVSSLLLADTLVGIELPAAVVPMMQEHLAQRGELSQLDRVLGMTFRRQHPELATLYLALASFNQFNVHTLPGTQMRCTPAALAATGVPTLFVVGAEDILFPPAIVQAVQSAVAGSHYVELPAAGHSAYFETPTAFNAVMQDWLRRTL